MTSRRFQRQPPNRPPVLTVRFDRPWGVTKRRFLARPNVPRLTPPSDRVPALISQPNTPHCKKSVRNPG